jgi:3-phenylpropionate/trans-cinnamate dioxygenase ferredoxin subunit
VSENRTIVRSAKVCGIDELAPGERRLVHVGRREVLLCRSVDGTFYAVSNACPHQGAPLCEGGFGGSTVAPEVGRYGFGLEGEVVRCPWHAWEFDVKTGHALFGEDKRIRTYEVWVEDEDVYVSIAPKGGRRSMEGVQ